ncbi:hypothetical protein Droror1_Dr00016156 [Drosera rotundifolia]
MSDPDHHQHHRPHRLSLPSRTAKPYPVFPSTPTPTPSKHRRHRLTHSLSTPKPHRSQSLSSLFLLLLLFSLRSLYSLLPFLSSPSFSLFPFSFLVSLFSSLLHLLSFLLLQSNNQQRIPISSLFSISKTHLRILIPKSFLLATLFLLRFQGLKYCGTAATIMAEFAGGMVNGMNGGIGLVGLGIGLVGLGLSWDRVECFPFGGFGVQGLGLGLGLGCVRVWPLVLPFVSGWIGAYERDSRNWGEIKELGRSRVRLVSLFLTTVLLAVPAAVGVLVSGEKGDGVGMRGLGWPLANTVVFGVVLSESCGDEKVVVSGLKDVEKEFLVTFVCMIVLELVYFPQMSLWGLLVCGFLFWVSIRQMKGSDAGYVEIGAESSESIGSLVMRPVKHILSERKSRKIALFLMINTGYMVVEFVVGFMSNSLGLISDACHMLFDCAALAIGLYASYISRLPANNQFNYGRGRFEVLSGYANAVFLVLVGALIVLESLERILDPQEISTSSLLTVSIGGLVVNVIGLIFFHEEHHQAHGGGGSCSHSHSHEHADHGHPHSDEHKHSEHEACDLRSQSMKHDDSNRDQHVHSHIHDHHQHQHEHDHHQHQHEHDHHSHQHEHDHHRHQQEHDHQRHQQEHDHHRHQHEHDHHHQHEHDHHHQHEHDHHHHQHEHDNHQHHHEHDNQLNHHYHREILKLGAHGSINADLLSSQSSSMKDHDNGVSYGHDFSELKKSLSGNNPQVAPKKNQEHRHHDHNMEGIFLHVLADTLGSVGVVISTLLIKYKGWLVADPACSIFISILIVSSVIPLLRNSAEILLQRVPRSHEHDIKLAVDQVLRMKGVSGI